MGIQITRIQCSHFKQYTAWFSTSRTLWCILFCMCICKWIFRPTNEIKSNNLWGWLNNISTHPMIPLLEWIVTHVSIRCIWSQRTQLLNAFSLYNELVFHLENLAINKQYTLYIIAWCHKLIKLTRFPSRLCKQEIIRYPPWKLMVKQRLVNIW